MYSEKSKAAVLEPQSLAMAHDGWFGGREQHTFCQLQVRYLMAWPASTSICFARMAELVSSLPELSGSMPSRTGAIRGPTQTPLPPNQEEK